MRKPQVIAIAALAKETRALSRQGQLLWQIPEDLKRFKELTTGQTVIMGRKTWESLPAKFRPLPNRQNIVISRNANYLAPGATIAVSPEAALTQAGEEAKVFIIGGGEIYAQFLPYTDKLYLTLVNEELPGDTYFPSYENDFVKIQEERRSDHVPSFSFVELTRK